MVIGQSAHTSEGRAVLSSLVHPELDLLPQRISYCGGGAGSHQDTGARDTTYNPGGEVFGTIGGSGQLRQKAGDTKGGVELREVHPVDLRHCRNVKS